MTKDEKTLALLIQDCFKAVNSQDGIYKGVKTNDKALTTNYQLLKKTQDIKSDLKFGHTLIMGVKPSIWFAFTDDKNPQCPIIYKKRIDKENWACWWHA